MKSLRSSLVSLAFGSVVLLAACLEPTQIELSLRTDVPFAAGRSVAISVSKDVLTDGTPPATIAEGPWNADGAIGTLMLLPSERRDEPVSVRAVLGLGRDPSTCTLADAKGCIFARRRLAFVPHEPLALPVTLYAACEGVPCDEGSTCTALGACVSADVDPRDCAEGQVCEPGLGEAGVPEGDLSSSSGSSGLPEASVEDATSSTSSSSSSSGGSNGCETIDFSLPARDFLSFGNTNSSADLVVDDPLEITIGEDGEVATFGRTVQISKQGCPLHFVASLSALTITNPSTDVKLFALKRNAEPAIEMHVRRDTAGRYALTVTGSAVEYAWPVPVRGDVEMILGLEPGGAPALRIVIGGVETVFSDLPLTPAPVTAVGLELGLSGARSFAAYKSLRYFFAP